MTYFKASPPSGDRDQESGQFAALRAGGRNRPRPCRGTLSLPGRERGKQAPVPVRPLGEARRKRKRQTAVLRLEGFLLFLMRNPVQTCS
jgi:hypothetical protein